MTDTARFRLEQAIYAVDYEAPAMSILDALLAHPEDLAEVAGLDHAYLRESARQRWYRAGQRDAEEKRLAQRDSGGLNPDQAIARKWYLRGQRETAAKIAEAIEADGVCDEDPYEWRVRHADIARSFGGDP